MIGGSNVLCENDDYVNMVPDDPDYQMLSDFTSMMEELNWSSITDSFLWPSLASLP